MAAPSFDWNRVGQDVVSTIGRALATPAMALSDIFSQRFDFASTKALWAGGLSAQAGQVPAAPAALPASPPSTARSMGGIQPPNVFSVLGAFGAPVTVASVGFEPTPEEVLAAQASQERDAARAAQVVALRNQSAQELAASNNTKLSASDRLAHLQNSKSLAAQADALAGPPIGYGQVF